MLNIHIYLPDSQRYPSSFVRINSEKVDVVVYFKRIQNSVNFFFLCVSRKSTYYWLENPLLNIRLFIWFHFLKSGIRIHKVTLKSLLWSKMNYISMFLWFIDIDLHIFCFWKMGEIMQIKHLLHKLEKWRFIHNTDPADKGL